jgi:hypothetical protein
VEHNLNGQRNFSSRTGTATATWTSWWASPSSRPPFGRLFLSDGDGDGDLDFAVDPNLLVDYLLLFSWLVIHLGPRACRELLGEHPVSISDTTCY